MDGSLPESGEPVLEGIYQHQVVDRRIDARIEDPAPVRRDGQSGGRATDGLNERHRASIKEFENFSSVKAKTRRRTPVEMSASLWACSFSTPASANTIVKRTPVLQPSPGMAPTR